MVGGVRDEAIFKKIPTCKLFLEPVHLLALEIFYSPLTGADRLWFVKV
jgi:hypothetical protein